MKKPKRKNILYMVTYSSGYCEPLIADSIAHLKDKYFYKQIEYGWFQHIMPIAAKK